MLISIIFMFTLSCTFSSHTSAGILNAVNNDSMVIDTPYKHIDGEQQALTSVSAAALGSETVAVLFDSKLESLTAALNRIDASVQNLQEKSHSWAILRHHIDAWNDQMKVHEQKMELLRRSLDDKLLSLELTLNHVLSKVIYLNDGCSSRVATAQETENISTPTASQLQSNSNRLLQVQGEMSSRLNNIIRHLQNIEKKQNECRRATDAVSAVVTPAKAPLPAAVNRTASASDSRSQSADSTNLPIKEIKQLHSLSKKNAKLLEHKAEKMNSSDERCDSLARNLNQRIDSISGELATFTGSSDLLLKRIELLLRTVALKAEQFDTKTNSKHNIEQTDDTGDTSDDDESRVHMEEENEQDNEVAVVKDVNVDIETNEVDDSGNVVSAKVPIFLKPKKHHCHELNRYEADNGIYKFGNPQLNEVDRDFNMRMCIFGNPVEDDGPAWTVIQNRGAYDVQENFNRSWDDYRNGFGSLERDFWFGNEFVHQLLEQDDYVLRVELTDDQGSYGWGEYNTFRLDSEEYNYNLMIGGFSSNGLPDALQFNNEQDFSTYDRRNDRSVDACCPCAVTYASGWWFDRCSEANLNGIYRYKAFGHKHIGIIWQDWPFEDYSLHTSRMMIRPRDNSQLLEDP